MNTINNLTTIYVSQENGSDFNQGFCSEANEFLTGPVKTIEKALSMVAEMRLFGAYQPVTIKIVDKVYKMKNPVKIDPSVELVTIEPLCETLLCGGEKIDWFEDDVFGDVKCCSADLSRFGDINFSDFYVEKERAVLPQYPENGFLKPVDVENYSTVPQDGSKWFEASKEDFEKIKSFKNVENCIISFNHYWVDEHTPIEKLEDETKRVYMKYRSRYTIEPTHDASKMEYIIENVSEMFKKPGQWYFDKAELKLYYIPKEKTEYKNIVGYIPFATQLFLIEGTENKKARNINIRNFSIAYTRGDRAEYDDEETFASDIQSVCQTCATIELKHSIGCMIENCKMYCLGQHAVGVREGCENIKIQKNEIYQIGCGGVVVRGGSINTDKSMHTHMTVISDNRIKECGRRYFAACGILLMNTYNNIISHNEISDLYYTGISCGWMWGYGESITHDNLIEKNHIYNLGGGVLSDMGGIYLLGRQKGTVVRGNHVHDVTCAHYGGWALYADEGTSSVTFENNVCYRTSSNCFHQHYGSANVVKNNIFALSDEAPVAMSRPELHLGAIFEKNIIVTNGSKALNIGYKDEETGCLQILSLKDNIYYDLKKIEPDMIKIGDKDYSYREFCDLFDIDTGSVCADPEFKDIANFDFELSKESFAIKHGFCAIDISDVGIR